MKHLLIIIFLIAGKAIAQCQTIEKQSRPEKDFEKFWTTFRDNYALFAVKAVDWNATYAKYRPLVDKKTNEKELIAVLGDMVAPLKDDHIMILKGEKLLYSSKKPSYFKEEFKGLRKEFWQMVNKTLRDMGFSEVKGVGPLYHDEHLYYVAQSTDVGYIRITRCFGDLESVFGNKSEQSDTDLMLALFDGLLKSLSGTNALIIDLRSNGGGHAGIELASRFVKEKTLTHYKSITQKGKPEDSALEPQYIEPNNGVRYLKPVCILTNDKTASSAEDFAVSLYHQPNVATIGTTTSGTFSDVLSTELSNNISFTLSNQCYYSLDKKVLEDVGIPAKIEVNNTKADIENGMDPVITKAIETLKVDVAK